MSETTAVDRDRFLKPTPAVIKAVPVPEFGDDAVIHVKGLTAKEWGIYEAGMVDENGMRDPKKYRDSMPRLVVHGCVNPDGSRMFTMQDLPLVQERLCGTIDDICNVIWEASGRVRLGNLKTTTDDEPPSD